MAALDIDMALYPGSANRAMANAALAVYHAIIKEGTQTSVIPLMQTREEGYETLNYHKYEQLLDSLFKEGKGV